MDLTLPSLALPMTASQMGNWLKAQVIGDPNRLITRLTGLSELCPGSLSYLSDPKLLVDPKNSSPSAAMADVVLLVPQKVVSESLSHPGLTCVVVANPKAAFAQVATQIFKKRRPPQIHPTAVISPRAVIGKEVYIGPYVVIEDGASVGDHCVVEASVYIGRDVKVGEQTHLYPHVVLLERVELGKRNRIFSGTVIGSDGFGLIAQGSENVEMPQLGTVRVEDDVLMGGNCSIDRATFGQTVIGAGTKLDNLVHIGHNVVIGKNGIICGQVGIAGSAQLGDGVVIGGQAGVGDHLKVGSGARLGAQTGVSRDLEGGKDYFLSPAIPVTQALKVTSVMHRLPELEKRVKRLEQRSSEEIKG